MTDAISYGWTGKILYIDLTTGESHTASTDPYKSYIGGMGLANKIMYDEVPAGTHPFAPENKIVFAVGPLTASGVPLAGRTTICSLSPFTKDNLLVDGHCGGMIGARIKQAGWDAIVLEGAAENPVYIMVDNDKVTIKSADFVWGLGTRATTDMLSRLEGSDVCVAAIGPAGENLLPYSCIINARNHSAGAGTGAVMGSKNVKALVVRGTGSVNVADPQAVAELSDYMLREVLGSNNNHVVPSSQQEWAEYYDPLSRWNARKDLNWTLAEGGPISMGEPKPGELNTVGYRCTLVAHPYMVGQASEPHIVKSNGCHGCPIHCYGDLRLEGAKDAGSYELTGNTCMAYAGFTYTNKGLKLQVDDDRKALLNLVMLNTIDDLGLWCNYGQLYRDLGYCLGSGIMEKVCSPEEYAAIPWDKIQAADPAFIPEVLGIVASNKSELSYVAHGTPTWTERWGVDDYLESAGAGLINPRGWPVHHSIECFGQVGGVYNMMFNRDSMIHSATNFQGCGLPFELKQAIAEEVWGGADAIDMDRNYTPMNERKANFCWWSIVTDVLHDSLTLCNWVWPMTMSPTAARDYRGDLDLEAKFFKAVTGEDVTTEQLYEAGARIMTLQRASTVKGMTKADGAMGNTNMRDDHDRICDWVFTQDPDLAPFTEGTTKMDRDDFATALTMVYQTFGWDPELGCPTAECLDAYGMADVKEDLASLSLLP